MNNANSDKGIGYKLWTKSYYSKLPNNLYVTLSSEDFDKYIPVDLYDLCRRNIIIISEEIASDGILSFLFNF